MQPGTTSQRQRRLARTLIEMLIGIASTALLAAIVQAVIAMAGGLDLQVVAEGVETEEQMAFLQRHSCDSAQGFLLSEPLAADAFEKLLRTEPASPAGSIRPE